MRKYNNRRGRSYRIEIGGDVAERHGGADGTTEQRLSLSLTQPIN